MGELRRRVIGHPGRAVGGGRLRVDVVAVAAAVRGGDVRGGPDVRCSIGTWRRRGAPRHW